MLNHRSRNNSFGFKLILRLLTWDYFLWRNKEKRKRTMPRFLKNEPPPPTLLWRTQNRHWCVLGFLLRAVAPLESLQLLMLLALDTNFGVRKSQSSQLKHNFGDKSFLLGTDIKVQCAGESTCSFFLCSEPMKGVLFAAWHWAFHSGPFLTGDPVKSSLHWRQSHECGYRGEVSTIQPRK